ncbi:MAG: Hsp20/alpha crystallin family protein [Thaumarchaeota archaeon]|nr:MAG: Hsp20/alpha crystallin family protein [Nitrososphaerota archaeon]
MEDQEVERVKKFLNANGYLVRKSDLAWILNQMAEALDRQVEEASGIVVRQLICEVITTGKEVKVITELPGVCEERIKMNVYDNELEVNAENEKRTYYEIIYFPAEADTRVFKSTFLNGLLEVRFEKKNNKKRGHHKITSLSPSASSGSKG